MFDVHFSDVTDDPRKVARAQQAPEARDPLVGLGFERLGFVEEYMDIPEEDADMVKEEAGADIGAHLLQRHVYEVLRDPSGRAIATVERHGDTPRLFLQTLLEDGTLVQTRNPPAFGVDSSTDHHPRVGLLVFTVPGLDVARMWQVHGEQVDAAVRARRSEPVAHDDVLVCLAMLVRQCEVVDARSAFILRIGIALFVTGLLMLGVGAIGAVIGVFVNIGAFPAKTLAITSIPVLALSFFWQSWIGPRVARLRAIPARRPAKNLLAEARRGHRA